MTILTEGEFVERMTALACDHCGSSRSVWRWAEPRRAEWLRCADCGRGTNDTNMCPHCGQLLALAGDTGLTASHGAPECPGSGQNPRNPQSDARPLWNGARNPHFAG